MTGTILIVDDDAEQLSLFQEALMPLGSPILTWSHGDGVVDFVLSNDVDVILLDLVLPRIDGMEICRRLRRLEPALPRIVMASGMDAPAYRDLAFSAGVDDYLVKPIALWELVTSIAAHRNAASALRSRPTCA